MSAPRPPLRTLGVVVRQGAVDAESVLARLSAAAGARGIEILVEPDHLESAPADTRPFSDDGEPPDFVIALGGDGTLLRAGRMILGMGIPLLGINLGRLGFLTMAGASEMEASLGHLADGDYELEERFTLGASALGPGGEEVASFQALNDIVVHKPVAARVARLQLRVGPEGREEDIGSFTGDGVIVASPTGSTAYSLSAGGPIVVPTMECLTVTPVCPHTLAVRPLVVPSREAVAVLPVEPDPSLVVTVDGMEGRTLRTGEWVRVRRGQAPLVLVRLPGTTFFGTLRRKLKWAARPGAEDED